MKVILLQSVRGLGEPGAVVDVAAGHARNLLFPNGLAEEASAANLERRAAALARAAKAEERERRRAQESAAKLTGAEVRLTAKAGTSGRLFGSVTAADIAAALAAQLGVRVDRRRIDLPDSLKTLGVHAVKVHLHSDLSAEITVRVVAEA